MKGGGTRTPDIYLLHSNPCFIPVCDGMIRLQKPVSPLDASTSRDAIDAEEIFEMIRHVKDPEHPLTLEQLKVVSVRFCLVSS